MLQMRQIRTLRFRMQNGNLATERPQEDYDCKTEEIYTQEWEDYATAEDTGDRQEKREGLRSSRTRLVELRETGHWTLRRQEPGLLLQKYEQQRTWKQVLQQVLQVPDAKQQPTTSGPTSPFTTRLWSIHACLSQRLRTRYTTSTLHYHSTTLHSHKQVDPCLRNQVRALPEGQLQDHDSLLR